MMKRVVCITLSIIALAFLPGCRTSQTTVSGDYSVGIDKDGYYEGFRESKYATIDLSELTVNDDDVVAYINESNGTSGSTLSDYENSVIRSVMTELGLNKKDVAENGDTLKVTVFRKTDAEEEELGQLTINAVKNGTVMQNSVIGAVEGDDVEIENYEISVDELADIRIHIDMVCDNSVKIDDVFAESVDKLNEFSGSKCETVDEYKSFIHEYVLNDLTRQYLDEYLSEMVSFDVDEKYVDYEVERLKLRVLSLGFSSVEEYYEAASVTESEAREDLVPLVKQYMILMAYAYTNGINFTDEEFNDFFTNYDLDSLIKRQGKPYLMRRVLLDKSMDHLLYEIKHTNS